MHLEGGEYMTGRDIQLAGLRSVVTDTRQLFLKPADARQFGAELRLLAGHRLFIGPYAQAFGSQTFPREQWAGVEFAQGGNVAVTDDVARADALALADVLEQNDQ